MQEIQVGEYVRVNNGFVAKVTLITDVAIRTNNMGIVWIDKRTIKKHSFNIIDLIEKDDYVNGKKVINIWEEPFGVFAGMILMQLEDEDVIPNMREIKSIVTHEQFDSVKYEVE